METATGWGPMLAVGAGTAVGLMFALWLLHLRLRNAAVVDVGWTVAVGIQALAAALLGPGDPTRRMVVGVVGGLWSARLALHLVRRVASEPEDPRYAEIRARWGGNL
ncbi:MAG: DUF1295 domain-containing protein, partial [Gemmatimonadaceae bacterium]